MTEMIRLGAGEFELRPLTLGQLRHLLDALDAMAGKSGGALIDAAAAVVTAGLAAAHPELTADIVLDCEASLAELNAAVAAILTRAGLHPAGEAEPVASPGANTAAMVGETPATASAPSTAPSPPAAAMPTR
jgi:hypothetical protein